MNGFWTFVMNDLVQHPLIFGMVVVIIVQLRDLKKDVQDICKDFKEHLKDHAKKEV